LSVIEIRRNCYHRPADWLAKVTLCIPFPLFEGPPLRFLPVIYSRPLIGIVTGPAPFPRIGYVTSISSSAMSDPLRPIKTFCRINSLAGLNDADATGGLATPQVPNLRPGNAPLRT
jgi:hypothetical protein